jgi:hypothetical protein
MRREVDDDPIRAILDRLLETPQAQQMLGKIQFVLDRAGAAIDPKARPAPSPPSFVAEGRPDPEQVSRRILHFGPAEPLNRASVTARRRELARFCHPDRGGSTEAMQAINKAADLLLAKC